MLLRLIRAPYAASHGIYGARDSSSICVKRVKPAVCGDWGELRVAAFVASGTPGVVSVSGGRRRGNVPLATSKQKTPTTFAARDQFAGKTTTPWWGSPRWRLASSGVSELPRETFKTITRKFGRGGPTHQDTGLAPNLPRSFNGPRSRRELLANKRLISSIVLN
jgi:hypothetical protein